MKYIYSSNKEIMLKIMKKSTVTTKNNMIIEANKRININKIKE